MRGILTDSVPGRDGGATIKHDGAMDWTAPSITRTEPPESSDERSSLDGFLDFHRQTLLWKCSGLTGDQLRLRAVGSSNVSLLGLVRHLTDVERGWFRVRFAGEQLAFLHSTDDNLDGDFDDVDTADAEADYASYLAEIELCHTAVAGRGLDETFVHPRRGVEMSLRWVYLHMIEEYARHNGHADLIREAIDGATGE
jgi:uncharacterized damage-inducible protein DinB